MIATTANRAGDANRVEPEHDVGGPRVERAGAFRTERQHDAGHAPATAT